VGKVVQVKQLKTAEDIYYANQVGFCPLCGKQFELDQEVVEVETEEFPWEFGDGSRTLIIIMHMDCIRKLF